jgi:DedD protein
VVLAGGLGLGIWVSRQPASPTVAVPPSRPAAEAILPDGPPSSASSPVPPGAAPPIAHDSVPTPIEPTAAPVPSPKPVASVPVAVPPKQSVQSHKAVAGSRPVVLPRHKPPPPRPQPAGNGRWVVQLGAFQSDDHAKLLVDTLAFHGHPARIARRRDKAGRDWFFVQIPGYATRAAAEAVARVLAGREHVPTLVFERRARPAG